MKKEFGKCYLSSWTGCWHFKFHGKPVRLTGNKASKEEAEKAKAKYLEDAKFTSTSTNTNLDHEKVSVLVQRYIDRPDNTNEARTNVDSNRVLLEFSNRFGNLEYINLTAAAVESWLKSHPRWGINTRHHNADIFKAWSNFWFRNEKVSRNKLKQLKLPRGDSRGEDYAITRDMHDCFNKASPDWLKDILCFLWETGCRPSECFSATVAEYRPEKNCLEKLKHKTVKKGSIRRITLSSTAKELVERLIAKHQTGDIFRGRDGGKLNRMVVGKAINRICDKLGLSPYQKKHIVPYSWRHGAAVRWLESGKFSEMEVASLLGHKSVELLRDVYGKARERVYRLADRLDAAN